MVALLLRQPTPQTLATAPTPQDDLDRQRTMTEAWRAYSGKLMDPLKVKADQPNDNVKVNRCSPIVFKTTSWLFGPTLKLECKDGDFMTDLWGDDDEMMTRLSEMKINGGVFGHVFVKLIPSPTPGAAPRLVNLNPQITRMVNHPDDCKLRLAYVIDYPGTQDLQKRQIIARIDPNTTLEKIGNYAPDNTWTITNYVRRGPYGNYTQDGPPDYWPYPFAPVIDWQNLPNPNEAWGTPNLTDDLVGLNKSINFFLSNLARIIKHHAHPLTVGINLRASEIQTDVDGMICLPSPDSKIDKLAPMDKFTEFLAVIMHLYSSMDELSRVPAVALGRMETLPRGNISGVALKLLLQPIMELTTQHQRLYGSGIRALSRAALVIAGKLPVAQFKAYGVDVKWQNLMPIDDFQAAQVAQILIAIGVSEETVFAQLGYAADEEFKKRVREAVRKQQAFGLPTTPQPGQPPQQQNQQQPGQPGQPPNSGNQQQQQGGQQGA